MQLRKKQSIIRPNSELERIKADLITRVETGSMSAEDAFEEYEEAYIRSEE